MQFSVLFHFADNMGVCMSLVFVWVRPTTPMSSFDLNTGWLFCWLVACNDAF